MAYRYDRINWQNKPNVATPISAENLNKMDKGIDDNDKAIGDLAQLNTSNKSSLVSAVNELNNNLAFQTTVDLTDCATFAEIFTLMRANPYRVGFGRVGNLDPVTNFKILVGNPTGFANYTSVYVRILSNNILQMMAVGALVGKFAIDYVIYDNSTYSRVGWNVLK